MAEQISNMNKISKAPCIKSNLDCKYGKKKKKTYVQKTPGLGFRFLHQIFLCFLEQVTLNFGVVAYDWHLVEPILYIWTLSISKNCDNKYNGK